MGLLNLLKIRLTEPYVVSPKVVSRPNYKQLLDPLNLQVGVGWFEPGSLPECSWHGWFRGFRFRVSGFRVFRV